VNAPLKRSAGLAGIALLASSGTLVCCVLPALMVAVGAGAVLAGWVSAVPQLIWLSEHKSWVFGAAALALVLAGVGLWHARTLPCPVDPLLARDCTRLRRISAALYVMALLAFATGFGFAFVLPLLQR
jgi:hypothetical protein